MTYFKLIFGYKTNHLAIYKDGGLSGWSTCLGKPGTLHSIPEPMKRWKEATDSTKLYHMCCGICAQTHHTRIINKSMNNIYKSFLKDFCIYFISVYVNESVCGKREVKQGQQISRSAIIGDCEDPIWVQVTKLPFIWKSRKCSLSLSQLFSPNKYLKKKSPNSIPWRKCPYF